MRFDILDRLGVAHECDGRTDRQTYRTAVNNSAVDGRALKADVTNRTLKCLTINHVTNCYFANRITCSM